MSRSAHDGPNFFEVLTQGQNSSPPNPWYAVMRRCGQINYNEHDPLTMDAEAWGDYWASLKVDAVLLNGGGIVAFYPTQVPYHHRSEFLGSRDLFSEMVAAMKRRRIRGVNRRPPKTRTLRITLTASPWCSTLVRSGFSMAAISLGTRKVDWSAR